LKVEYISNIPEVKKIELLFCLALLLYYCYQRKFLRFIKKIREDTHTSIYRE